MNIRKVHVPCRRAHQNVEKMADNSHLFYVHRQFCLCFCQHNLTALFITCDPVFQDALYSFVFTAVFISGMLYLLQCGFACGVQVSVMCIFHLDDDPHISGIRFRNDIRHTISLPHHSCRNIHNAPITPLLLNL